MPLYCTSAECHVLTGLDVTPSSTDNAAVFTQPSTFLPACLSLLPAEQLLASSSSGGYKSAVQRAEEVGERMRAYKAASGELEFHHKAHCSKEQRSFKYLTGGQVWRKGRTDFLS
jgi:hypothetical protein